MWYWRSVNKTLLSPGNGATAAPTEGESMEVGFQYSGVKEPVDAIVIESPLLHP